MSAALFRLNVVIELLYTNYRTFVSGGVTIQPTEASLNRIKLDKSKASGRKSPLKIESRTIITRNHLVISPTFPNTFFHPQTNQPRPKLFKNSEYIQQQNRRRDAARPERKSAAFTAV